MSDKFAVGIVQMSAMRIRAKSLLRAAEKIARRGGGAAGDLLHEMLAGDIFRTEDPEIV